MLGELRAWALEALELLREIRDLLRARHGAQ
jgi:hypothetical protein